MPAWGYLMNIYNKIRETLFGSADGGDRARRKSPRRYPDRQELANADKFYSNGVLVETVYAEEAEAQAEVDLEQQQGSNVAATHIHPYRQPNRMTTVMMPTDEEETIVIR